MCDGHVPYFDILKACNLPFFIEIELDRRIKSMYIDGTLHFALQHAEKRGKHEQQKAVLDA